MLCLLRHDLREKNFCGNFLIIFSHTLVMVSGIELYGSLEGFFAQHKIVKLKIGVWRCFELPRESREEQKNKKNKENISFISGLIGSKNQIFISLENYAQLLVNTSF